jgi:hypothetical protein
MLIVAVECGEDDERIEIAEGLELADVRPRSAELSLSS